MYAEISEGFDPSLLVCTIKRKAKYIDKQIKCSYFNPYGKKKTCFGSTENRHENLGHE